MTLMNSDRRRTIRSDHLVAPFLWPHFFNLWSHFVFGGLLEKIRRFFFRKNVDDQDAV